MSEEKECTPLQEDLLTLANIDGEKPKLIPVGEQDTVYGYKRIFILPEKIYEAGVVPHLIVLRFLCGEQGGETQSHQQ